MPNWYDKRECVRVVKKDGYALRYVKRQTPEICLEAVKRDGYALRYVEEQTPEICMEAIKQNGYALRYVKEQTPEMCLEAIKQSINYKNLINIPLTDEIILDLISQTI